MEGITSSCTTILIGKKASYDGSTMMSRTVDASSGTFFEVKYIINKPESQPKKYTSVLSKCEIDLPENPLQYTSIPLVNPKYGIWGEVGINSLNVGMTGTETITSNSLILGADPLIKTGIGEEDYLTIVLPYIKNAREGVLRLGELLEKYGTHEMNGIGFQDENEIWYMETIGGHHYIARRVPDDCYIVNPNQQGIDVFDFVDAFGKQENHICSKDFIDFLIDNHLDLNFNKEQLKNITNYKIRRTVGSHTDFDYSYNTCRAWFMLKYFNPHTKYEIEDFDLPWCMKPEHKISIQDVKYVLSSHYQNTKYDPYLRYGDDKEKGKYRPIGVNRTIETSITQIRSYLPDKIKSIQWVAFGSNPFNAFIPQYTMVSDTPDYLKNVTSEVNTNCMYWNNRIIAALVDAHYNNCLEHVDRYQLSVLSKSHEFLNQFDKKFIAGGVSEKFLEECNQTISDYFQKETGNLLSKVLFTASLGMKNAYARSDA